MITKLENKKEKRSGWIVGFSILLALGLVVAIIVGIMRSLDTCGWLDIKLNRSSCQAAYTIGDGNMYAGLAISDDGELLAALDMTRLMVVETQTGKIIAKSELIPYLHMVSISPDGRYAGAIRRIPNLSGEILILDTENGETITAGGEEGIDHYSYFLFSPNSKEFLYTAAINGKEKGVYKLDLETGSSDFLLDAYGPLFFSADGNIMGTAGETGIQLWNYKDGIASLIQEIPIPSPVRAAALSPDGRELVVATAYSENPDFSYNVTVWSLPSGEYDRLFKKSFLVGMTPRLVYSPDSELLVVSECEGFLYIVSDGTYLERLKSLGFKWTYNCISDVVFSPEGDVLYYAGNKKLVEWKVPSY